MFSYYTAQTGSVILLDSFSYMVPTELRAEADVAVPLYEEQGLRKGKGLTNGIQARDSGTSPVSGPYKPGVPSTL